LIDEVEEYEVECIVGERVAGRGRNRGTQYLIKWKGWPVEHNEWV
jgi:hypothetical protein